MSEKNDWKLLRDKMKYMKGRWDRMENGVGVGMPDINFCLNGVEGWIEMKSPTEPKHMHTPLFGSNHRISQDQKNWFKRQMDAGGRAFILIGTDKRWMLIHGRHVETLNTLTVIEIMAIAEWLIQRPVRDPGAWNNLREVLIK